MELPDIGSLTLDQAQELMNQLRDKLKDLTRSSPRTVGRPAIHYPACLAWDWSKSNSEIARETGVNYRSICVWRRKLKKPAVERQASDLYAGSSPATNRVDFSGVDWTMTDASIGRALGCTREFVRQKRAQFKQPKMYSWDKEYEKFKAEFGGRETLTLAEARKKFPTMADQTFRKRCGKAGIKVQRPIAERIHHWSGINFQLPNLVLSNLWKIPVNQVAMHRSNHLLGRPLFRSVNGTIPEIYRSLVEAEKVKAEEWFKAKETQAPLPH